MSKTASSLASSLASDLASDLASSLASSAASSFSESLPKKPKPTSSFKWWFTFLLVIVSLVIFCVVVYKYFGIFRSKKSVAFKEPDLGDAPVPGVSLEMSSVPTEEIPDSSSESELEDELEDESESDSSSDADSITEKLVAANTYIDKGQPEKAMDIYTSLEIEPKIYELDSEEPKEPLAPKAAKSLPTFSQTEEDSIPASVQETINSMAPKKEEEPVSLPKEELPKKPWQHSPEASSLVIMTWNECKAKPEEAKSTLDFFFKTFNADFSEYEVPVQLTKLRETF